MTDCRLSRLVIFLLAAACIAAAAAATFATSRGDQPPRRRSQATRAQRPEVPETRPALMPPPRQSVHAEAARTVAGRFAAAWRPWDAGRRTSRIASILRRFSVAALWRRLVRERSRQIAARPPASLALGRIRPVVVGPGAWRAVLTTRHPAGDYLATLVIVATPRGPRIADVEH